jgi:uncharacterized protein YciI
MRMTQRFIVTRAPGAAWDHDKPTREQAGWEPHAAFMDALADERFVAFGGPVVGQDKFVLIVEARDEAAIRARLALDPWTVAGLLRTLAIEPWTIWLGVDERIDTALDTTLYLVAYGPGPRWDATQPRREQTGWDAHATFMDALLERGVALLGGPIDAQRALLVMQHDDKDGLRTQLALDPWYDGVLTIEYIEPWTLWLHRPRAADACLQSDVLFKCAQAQTEWKESNVRTHDVVVARRSAES